MYKTVLKIDGMKCGMCETHVNDVVRKTVNVKNVTSSHAKKSTVIISEEQLDAEALESAIEQTGYKVLSVESSPYEKKKFFGLFGR